MTSEAPEADAGHVLDSSAAGKSAVRGSVLLSAGYVAGLGLSVISAPLLTRHLGAVRFGHYAAVIALVAIVLGLTEGGVNSIALREYAAREGSDRDSVMRDLIGLRIVLSALTAVVAVALALAFGYSDTLVVGTALAVCGQVLQLFQAFLGMSLQANMRFGWLTGLEFLGQLATVTMIVGLALAGAGLLPFFVVPIAAACVTLPVMLRVTRGFMPIRPAFHPPRWLPLVKATIPFALAIAVSVLYFRVALIGTSLLSSKLQTGYFSASFRVVEVLAGVPSLVAGAGFPIIARAVARSDEQRLRYAASRLIDALLVLGTFLSVSLVLGAGFVMEILGPEYRPSVPVLRVQGLALVATCMAVSSGYVLLALHRHVAILVANAAALVTAVLLVLLLVPPLGAEGSALAALLAELALGAVEVAMLSRARPQVAALVTRRVVQLVPLGAVCCLYILIPGIPSLAAWIAGAATFAVLLQVTGNVPDELHELLGQWRARLSRH